ncbi:hypothetical protein [Cryobacterium tagatosivorans]|uniref:MmyB-like transcription regulator ligand binding domain-containing protein n=1 Tax=Cryobacterium tagatosivorans TaxID=1259199 RepID=A0A4R8UIT8_9MICO|nr:hypothetical protein [Cryobacterium tagatosivorans]TFB54284.1 hypothetical protein E3O23_03805 [Cryobacterium tagatosivorans]
MSTVPVFVQNGRLDPIAANHLGRALFCFLFEDPERPMNAARFVFLDARAQDFYRDWESTAEQIVAILRTILHTEAGRNPYARALTDLVGELSTRSDQFRTLWASHIVRERRTGIKSIHHPIVGDLDLTYEGMQLAAEPELLLLAYAGVPGSASSDGLQLLAGWVAGKEYPSGAAISVQGNETATGA